ncbi:MAG: hypothetical protein ACOC0N_07580 [Chroococcales cyanobacterium]
MADNSQTSYFIPPDLQAKIERLATERNRSVKDILDEAIALYLGETVEKSSDRIQALETEVATLKEGLTELTGTIQALQQRLFSAASILTIPQSQSSIPTQTFEESEPMTYEEIEDEPDEILYDFLEPEDR